MGILAGVGILLGAYSVFAGRAVRGIGVYTLGKKLGWFLSVSRHYATAAAIILLTVFVVVLILKLLKKRDAQASASEERQNELAFAKKDGKKIRPAAPQPESTAKPQQGSLSVSAPTEEQHQKPNGPQTVSDQETQLMPEDEPQANSGNVCPNCGADVKSDGAKFCTKCGAQIKAIPHNSRQLP